jgi:hypothetical protein
MAGEEEWHADLRESLWERGFTRIFFFCESEQMRAS